MAERTSERPSFRQRIPKIRFQRADAPSDGQSATATYYLIMVPAVLLGFFGLFMVFSATAVSNIMAGVNPYVLFIKTLLIAAGALIVAFTASRLAPNFWDRIALPLYGAALGLQLLVIPFGIGVGGNVNWLPVPGTGQVFQPSEFLKLATVLLIAKSLSRPQMNLRSIKQVALAVGVPSILSMLAVMAGSDMGTMLIFLAIAIGILWIAGVPAAWFAGLFAVGGTILIFLVAVSPSRTRRVFEFLPGFGTPPSTSAPTQMDHGLWALASGGLTGLGPGASREKWDYLQEAHTDFILAIVGEEFGLVGTLSVLLLFGLMVYGALRLAANGKDPFIRLGAAGIGSWFIAQGLINVGTVTGLTPVIGVPFPLVSYGGSSLLMTAAAVGVLLSFARFEAGFGRWSKWDPDTAGKDPRIKRVPRKA